MAALLLFVAGLQTVQAQGFRVYKTDGTVIQFSLRTDSIVFYDGIGSDVEFGPFTPVNQCIVGTWSKSKYENVTFNEDGTTDYMNGATYEFLPYQGTVIIYNASGAPVSYFKVLKVTADQMLVVTSQTADGGMDVWSSTKPVYLVRSIVLSETLLILQPDESKRLTATVEPSNADNPAVTWESSNESVAIVSNEGFVTAIAGGTCTITCSAMDGSGVKAECQVSVGDNTHGFTNGHEWVDLGLPSGTLWATCNIGANRPEEYGDYFAWGETKPKNDYTKETYMYYNKTTNTYTKYNLTDTKKELDSEDDAATVNWGSEWQMPSLGQCIEIENTLNTTTEWITVNGINGKKVTSKSNGNSIFLPAAGDYTDTSLKNEGSRGYYWMCSIDGYYSNYNRANELYFDSGRFSYNFSNRHYRYTGRSVRPVRKQ